jgi:hypothetical protein
MQIENSPRFLLTRLAGLGFLLSLCAVFFADDSPAEAPFGATQSQGGEDAVLPRLNGDGRADQTEELQEWFAHRRAEGHRIDLPAGAYRITQPIVVNLDEVGPVSISGGGVARLIMAGPGPALKLVGTHEGTADPDSVKPNVWANQRMPLIDGLEIVGEHPEACGIELTGTMQASVSRVNIRHCLHAIQLTNRNRNVLISDVHLYENRGCGVLLDNVDLHQINVTGSHISYNRGGGVVSRQGNVRNLHITGCDIESNMGRDAEPTANVLIDCRNSRYGTAEVAITGCTIQHNSAGPESANVRIIGRSDPAPGQDVVREGNVTITGNVLSDVQVNVHLKDCRGVTLTGNTFWMGYGHNLLVEDCTHIVAGPNNLDRNPRYAYGTALETKNRVAFRNCEDCTISGLHVTNVWNSDAAVTFENCRWMNIADCTVLDSDGVGILLKECEHCQIAGCMVRDARRAAEDVVAIQEVSGAGNRIANGNLVHGRVERAGESR